MRVPSPNRRLGGNRGGVTGGRRGHATFSNYDGTDHAFKRRFVDEEDEDGRRVNHGAGSFGNSAVPVHGGLGNKSRNSSDSS